MLHSAMRRETTPIPWLKQYWLRNVGWKTLFKILWLWERPGFWLENSSYADIFGRVCENVTGGIAKMAFFGRSSLFFVCREDYLVLTLNFPPSIECIESRLPWVSATWVSITGKKTNIPNLLPFSPHFCLASEKSVSSSPNLRSHLHIVGRRVAASFVFFPF